MIFRKPFAFLIKHFRIIHLLLTLLIAYLVYKTSTVLVFFNEYISASYTTIDDVAGKLLSFPMFLDVFFIMAISMVILTILKMKKKPVKFYLFSIITCVITLTVFMYGYSILDSLHYGLVDIKFLELVRDLFLLVTILQIGIAIYVGIRSLGLNIKDFTFGENIEGIEITAADNEEFEVDIDVDTNIYKRYLKRFIRFTKYIWVENRFIFTLFLLIVVSAICTAVYFKASIYSKTLQKNVAFTTNEFILNVTNSYLTDYDYKGKQINENKSYVVVQLKARKLGTTKKQLNMGRFALKVGSGLYYHTTDFEDQMMDLGNTYKSDVITINLETYILVFEIPSSLADKNMILRYTDTNDKIIKVDITPTSLNKESSADSVNLQEDLVFKDSVLKKTTLNINQYAVSDKFRIDYNYCYQEDNCIASNEYVTPSTADNYKKSLLKIVGTITYDDSLAITKTSSVYRFMTYFGKLKYTINDTEKTMNIEFKLVKPIKTINQNEYYIEVLSEVKDATSIKLEFNIRNKVYTYVLK